MVQNKEQMKLKQKHLLLTCADNVNFLSKHKYYREKHRLVASREAGIRVIAEETYTHA
jgi:hypothetical protein